MNKEEMMNRIEVSDALDDFLDIYEKVRTVNGLKGISDSMEVCCAMADKHGRVCRLAKHAERNDPKPMWQEEMGEAISGYIAYAALLCEHYGINLTECFVNELDKAVEQHGKKDEDEPSS